MIGKNLGGRYEVKAVIGQGGFATVYRATQLSVGRDVAVKVLSLDASGDETVGRRFGDEARIISQLRHPNTLKLIDFGETEEGRIYLVMELLEGAPLDEIIKAGPMDPARVAAILKQVAGALEEAHDLGVVHRDLKPANIFIERVGRREVAKVLDFGIAKVHSQQSHTMTGQMFGTPLYMSPEQVKGTPIDGRSDLYSLGVVAYQCLTGQVPFSGNTPYSILMKHTNEEPPPMLSINPAMVHTHFESLVMSLLAKEAEDRPASSGDLVELLDEISTQLKAGGHSQPVLDVVTSSITIEPKAVQHPTVLTEIPKMPTGEPQPPPPKGAFESAETDPRYALPEDVAAPKRRSREEKRTVLGESPIYFESSTEGVQASETKSSNKGIWLAVAGLALALGGSYFMLMGPDKSDEPETTETINVATSINTTPSPQAKPIGDAPDAALLEPKMVERVEVAKEKPDARPRKRRKPVRRRKRTPSKPVTVAKPDAGSREVAKDRVKSKPRVSAVKVMLAPRKAVYSLLDQPRLLARALDADGNVIPDAGSVKWTIEPAGVARVRNGKLRFSKDSRGKIKGCFGAVCGSARFMSLDDTGLP